MAFVVLMTTLGYEGKILQRGVHTWSALWCLCRASDGKETVVAAFVDNTFHTIRWVRIAAGIELADWRSHTGEGTALAWYNRTARGDAQLDQLRGIEVTGKARARIRQFVSAPLVTVSSR